MNEWSLSIQKRHNQVTGRMATRTEVDVKTRLGGVSIFLQLLACQERDQVTKIDKTERCKWNKTGKDVSGNLHVTSLIPVAKRQDTLNKSNKAPIVGSSWVFATCLLSVC